ncbi:MAG: transposase [Candidatus Symbiodolus clandestinus]
MISQHKRPKYSLNFKQDAAKLVLEKGYSHQQAADSLGISLSAIRRWVRAEKGYPTPLGNNQANLNLSEREELIKLECAEFFFYLLDLLFDLFRRAAKLLTFQDGQLTF